LAEDLILNALRKSIEQSGVFRLVAAGEAPEQAGLFPDGKKGPAKKAIQECTEGEKPLLEVRKEPGKGKTSNEFAKITQTGLQRLFALAPLTQFPELISIAAPLLRTRVIRSALTALGERAEELDPWEHRRLVEDCLKATQTQFDSIEVRLQKLVGEQKQLGESINEFLRVARDRFEQQRRRLAEELGSLADAATALVPPTEGATGDSPRRPRLPEWQRVPTSNPEIDFQKNLSEELVFAWQDAATAEAKDALDRALFNVGVERLAAPGDVIAFDGSAHVTDDDVVEGEPVEVVLPAWQLVTPRGTSLLARAKVVKSGRPLTALKADKEGAELESPPALSPAPPPREAEGLGT
jgi:hypothetical protein